MIKTLCAGILSIGITASLGGCMKTVDTACTAFKPIRYSASQDSASTVQEVREHNAAWMALCQ